MPLSDDGLRAAAPGGTETVTVGSRISNHRQSADGQSDYVVHGASTELLDRALVGWERFLGSFEEPSNG